MRLMRARLTMARAPALARGLARAHAANEVRQRAAANAARCAVVQRHSMLLRSALRSGDEPRLAMAIELAKKDSVPKGVIDKALASTAEHEAAEPIVVEAAGPGGVLIVLRARAPNRATLLHDLRRCFNQAEVGALSAALWAFEKEASFCVPASELGREALELLAIEHGADDVRDEDDDGAPLGGGGGGARVVCTGDDAEHRLARLLAEVAAASGAAPRAAETAYRAARLVALPEGAEELEAVTALVEALGAIEGVEGVFTNLDYGCGTGGKVG